MDPTDRLVAMGYAHGVKMALFRHTVPLFGRVARLCSLKSLHVDKKTAPFSLDDYPSKQV